MTARAANDTTKRPARAAATQIEVVLGRGPPTLLTADSGERTRVEFHAIVRVSASAVLVAGAILDLAERLRSLRLGDRTGVAVKSIAITPKAFGSLVFLGLVPTSPDVDGLHFEIEARDGERIEGRVPEFEGLAPFLNFIASADVEKMLAWTAKSMADFGALAAGETLAPALETLLDAVMRRLEARPAGSHPRICAYLDAAERIGTHGLVAKGWAVYDRHDTLTSLVAVALSGARAEFPLPLPATTRPDVVAAMGGVAPNCRSDCGFVAYAPFLNSGAVESRWFLEARLQSGAVDRFPFRLSPARSERSAIEAIILWAEDNAVDLNDVFARSLDVPVGLLWRSALARRREPAVTSYGERGRPAEISIVVPLYGRLDFLKHQIARFSNDPDFVGKGAIVDLIYVLDDPRYPKDFELKARLAADAYGVPFRVVDLLGNFGYSTACNVGASFATGETLILMNSDVMPKRSGWASQLARTLKATQNCGVLGCRLLFEDESIQHAGMEFRKAIMLPGAWTNEHPGKGLPVTFDPHPTTEKASSVTGACLAMPRQLYLDLGGLCDTYIIGDFEDSDLCLKAREKGWDVYYTPDVELYHLERQSMRMIGAGHADWRQKLTLFNMWRHARAWGHRIAPEDAR